MNEIIPNVFVGPISVVYNKNELEKVDVIVNCTRETYECSEQLHENIKAKKYYCIPVDDTGRLENITNFIKYAPEVLDNVTHDYNNGLRILIHCSQGVQRSAAFMAYFLVKVHNMALNDAIDLIVQQKPNCFSHGRQVNFMDALVVLCNNKKLAAPTRHKVIL